MIENLGNWHHHLTKILILVFGGWGTNIIPGVGSQVFRCDFELSGAF